MGDYSKQTWVDDDGTDSVGTVFTKARMDNIEQGIFDATKQASMDHNTAYDGTNATTNDKKRIVWRRSTDGSYLASVEAVDATGNPAGTRLAYLKAQARMDSMASSDQVRAILQAYGTGGANPGRAAVIANYMRGASGSASVWVEVKKESGAADPTLSPMVLDETGYSDWVRVTRLVYASRPAASTANQNQFFFATDTKALYYNDDGTRWIQLAGPQEASTITTPSTGFGTHYVNYNTSFRYWKDALGYVHVTGEINDDGTGLASLSANAVVWDGFPAGYRPTSRLYVRANGNPATNRFLINTSGQIRVDDNGANSTRYSNFGHFTFPTF
jgi:hypothetical protein